MPKRTCSQKLEDDYEDMVFDQEWLLKLEEQF